MYLADYHTHTQFSPDAHDPMTVMAQAALDAGMDEICFTDHVEPLTWGSNELRPPYDWSALTEDFANVQAALGDRIHLRLGMEMGDAQKAPTHMKKLLEDAPQFDFIIGSVHLLSERFGSEDLYLYTPKDQAEAQTALGDYLEEVLALAKLGGFTRKRRNRPRRRSSRQKKKRRRKRRQPRKAAGSCRTSAPTGAQRATA